MDGRPGVEMEAAVLPARSPARMADPARGLVHVDFNRGASIRKCKRDIGE